MILTCPSCQTRYQVEDTAVSQPGGRLVRCANCGHAWHVLPAPAATGAGAGASGAGAPGWTPLRSGDAAAATGAAAADRTEPAGPVPAAPAPAEPSTAALRAEALAGASAVPRRHSGGLVALLAILLIVAAAIMVAVLFRDRIVADWPQAARVYGFFGLETPAATQGLEVKVAAPARTAENLVVNGDIKNNAGAPRNVPKLRIALRDSSNKELDAKTIAPPIGRLLPGEVAHFSTTFDHPDPAATDIAVTFVTD